jgi:hypothetical protein
MLGALARTPASTRFRAGRGIAIAVVTVASLGVGGLAAAGPGVFQSAADKARSFVSADAAESSEDADAAANDGDPLSESLPDTTRNGAGVAAGAAGSTALESPAAGDCSAVPCGSGTMPAHVVPPSAPPPECADGTHGGEVSDLAKGSVPRSDPDHHGNPVADAARAACTPQRDAPGVGAGGTNPNKPEQPPAGPPISTPAHEPPPVTAPPVAAPPVTIPPRPPTGPPTSTPGSGNGQGNGGGQGSEQSNGGQGGEQGGGQENGQGNGQGSGQSGRGAGNGG